MNRYNWLKKAELPEVKGNYVPPGIDTSVTIEPADSGYIDYMRNQINQSMQTMMDGRVVGDVSMEAVRENVRNALENMDSVDSVVDVSVDPDNPTQVNVSARIQPVFPMEYASITYSMGTENEPLLLATGNANIAASAPPSIPTFSGNEHSV